MPTHPSLHGTIPGIVEWRASVRGNPSRSKASCSSIGYARVPIAHSSIERSATTGFCAARATRDAVSAAQAANAPTVYSWRRPPVWTGWVCGMPCDDTQPPIACTTRLLLGIPTDGPR